MDLDSAGSMAVKRRQLRTLEGTDALDFGVEKGLWDLQKPPRHRPDITWLRKWAMEGKCFPQGKIPPYLYDKLSVGNLGT